MRIPIYLLALLSLFFFTKSIQAQTDPIEDKFLSQVELSEKYYDDGAYIKALQRVKKSIKKFKGLGKDYLVTQLEFYLAKYNEATGNYIAFEETVEKYIKHSAQKGPKSMNVLIAKLNAAELYVEYGNLVIAERYLKEGEALAEELSVSSTVLPYISSIKLQIAFKKGDKGNFDANLPQAQAFYSSMYGATTSYFNHEKQAFVTKNNTLRDQKRYKNMYATTLLQEADFQRQEGNYDAASVKLVEAEAWILQNLTNVDVSYIDHSYYLALLMMDKGDSRETLRKHLENSVFKAERILTMVHKVSLKLHELMLNYYIESKYVQRYKEGREDNKLDKVVLDVYMDSRYPVRSYKQLWEMRQNAQRYYGKDKVHHGVYQRLYAKKSYKSTGIFIKRKREKRGTEASYNKTLAGLFDNTVKVPPTHPERIRLAHQLSEIKTSEDQIEEALPILEEMVRMTKNVYTEESIPYHQSNIYLADFLSNYTSEFAKADSLYKASLEGIDKLLTQNSLTYFTALNHYADHLYNYERYLEADSLYVRNMNEAVKIYGKQHMRYAYQLQKVINIHLIDGDYDKVSAHIDTLLHVFDIEYNPSMAFEYSKALETAARYFSTMGLYDVAKSYLLKSTRYYNKTGGSIVNSSSIDELANLYIKMERYDETKILLNQAIDIRTKRYGEDSRFLISPLAQLGYLQTVDGDYIESEVNIERAHSIAIKEFGERSLRAAECLEIKAFRVAAMGDLDAAQEHIQKVISIQKENIGDDHIQIANTITQLALIKLNAGEKFQTVDSLLNISKEIIVSKLGMDNPVYAEILKRYAEVYIREKEFAKAEEQLDKALSVLESLEEKSSATAEVYLLKGDASMQQNKLEVATTNYIQGRDLMKKLFGKENPRYLQALSRLSRVYLAQNKLKETEATLDELLNSYKKYISDNFMALSDREKSKFWATIKGDFEFYYSFAARKSSIDPKIYNKVYDNVLLTKSLLLSTSIKLRNSILNSKDDSLISNYTLWANKRQQLIEAPSLSQEQLKEQNIDIKLLEKEIEELEKALSRQSTFFQAKTDPIDLSELKAVMRSKEYAIEIIRYRNFDLNFSDSIIYMALITDANTKTNVKSIALPNGHLFESRYLKFYRNMMEYKVADTLSYSIFYKPIDDVLPDDAKIFISLEGVYTQLNLEGMLYNGVDYLIDKNNITFVTSTGDLIDRTNKSVNNGKYCFVANPIYYDESTDKIHRRVAQLPGTKDEVEGISNILKNAVNENQIIVKLEKLATENFVKDVKSPRVLHLSTHGFFMEEEGTEIALEGVSFYRNPLLRAGLLFNNAGTVMDGKSYLEFNSQEGVLTAYEVMSMNLEGTELVVLSACETGKGDVSAGDGVFGLQRAFKLAGADAIIMSLFKVDDQATKDLLILFYEYWTKTGDKHLAFIQAKKELRKEYDSPIYWAAFIMVEAN